jgi:phage shock protein C
LSLDRGRAWVGGVCAGLANYLNIDILIVRIGCAIGMLTWWPTIIAYIACYLCLSESKPSIKEFGSNFANTRIARHFKKVDYKKRIYKSTRDKKIAGVCAGIAQYFEVSPFIIRAGALGSLFFGPLAFIAYIAAAVIMDRDPNEELYDQRDAPNHRQTHGHRQHSSHANYHKESYSREAYDRESRDPGVTNTAPLDKRDMRDCVGKFSRLETKLRSLEAAITSKKFKLHSEMKNL